MMNTNITLPSCPIERKAFKQTAEYSMYKMEKRQSRLNQYIEARRQKIKLRRDESLKEALETYEGQAKEIPFANKYWAFDDGRIYSYFSEGFMKQCATNDGYKYVGLSDPSKGQQRTQRQLVHRLIVQTFIGEIPKGYEVNHKDFTRDNNRLENLEIITLRDNRMGRRPIKYTRRPITQETRAKMSIAQKARYAHSRKNAA